MGKKHKKKDKKKKERHYSDEKCKVGSNWFGYGGCGGNLFWRKDISTKCERCGNIIPHYTQD